MFCSRLTKAVLAAFVTMFLAINSSVSVSDDAQAPAKGTIAWGESRSGRAIAIRVEKSAYAPEEPVRLRITLRNVGQKAFKIGDGDDDLENYKIRVVYSDGKDTELTAYGKHSERGRSAAVRSYRMATLRPGEDHSVDFPLSRFFDLSLPDKYAVVVSRGVLSEADPKKRETVTSNKLLISIDDGIPNKEESGRAGIGR